MCGVEKHFKYKSKFILYEGKQYFCSSCKKKNSLNTRTRSCPKCTRSITHQSPNAAHRAKELNSICKNCKSNQIPEILSEEQQQILNGLMLGDGSIVFPHKKRSGHPRLSITRQIQDKDYLFWQYEIFKNFYGTPPKYNKFYHNKVDKYYENFACRTKTGQVFTDYYNKWYLNKKKIVPQDLELTPLTILIWFLDDGCVVKSSENGLTIKFSTDGFTKSDTNHLAVLLESFIHEKINVYKNGSGFILKAATLAAIKIIKIIDPIFPNCMERKRTWKNFNWDYFNKNQNQFGGQKLQSVA
jgi:hypothetical protein